MARIHRRTVQKDLHDPDNHDGVITHPFAADLERSEFLAGDVHDRDGFVEA